MTTAATPVQTSAAPSEDVREAVFAVARRARVAARQLATATRATDRKSVV